MPSEQVDVLAEFYFIRALGNWPFHHKWCMKASITKIKRILRVAFPVLNKSGLRYFQVNMLSPVC